MANINSKPSDTDVDDAETLDYHHAEIKMYCKSENINQETNFC